MMDSRGFAYENYDKFHIFVCFIVAITMISICLVRGETLFAMAMWTSIAIVVFWYIGNLGRYYIVTRIFPPPEEQEFVYDESMYDELMAEENPEEVMADAPADPPAPAAHEYMSRE